MAGEPLKLIVGLGNPGIEYARTRHNAGFQVVDELARRHQATFRSEPRHQAELARARIGAEDLWLLKPMSYMNRSGDPVLIREALLVAADAVPVLLTEGAQSAMNRLHSRGPSPGEPPATNS